MGGAKYEYSWRKGLTCTMLNLDISWHNYHVDKNCHYNAMPIVHDKKSLLSVKDIRLWFMPFLKRMAMNCEVMIKSTHKRFIFWLCNLQSDCRSRGREFNPGPVPYFCRDWSWNHFYGHSPPFHSRTVVVSFKRKYVNEVLVNCLFKLAQERVWLGELTVPPGP